MQKGKSKLDNMNFLDDDAEDDVRNILKLISLPPTSILFEIFLRWNLDPGFDQGLFSRGQRCDEFEDW